MTSPQPQSLSPPPQKILSHFITLGLITLCSTSPLTTACTSEPNTPPTLIGLSDLTISANVSAQVELLAADPEQQSVTFEMEISPPPPTRTSTQNGTPRIQQLSPYAAVFTWTPGNADVGVYALSIRVTDAFGAQSAETVSLTVTDSGVGGTQLVRFLEPAGEVITLDLSLSSCLSVPITLQADALDAAEVSMSLSAPTPEGMTLTPNRPKRYLLSWCPNPAQIAERSQHPLLLTANNTRGLPPAEKRLLIRLIGAQRGDQSCDGAPPTLRYEPIGDQRGAHNIEARVMVWDDLGVKGAPTLAYELAPVDQLTPSGAWIERVMELDDAYSAEAELSAAESAWRALIPPPHTAGQARVFYQISVSDDDDRESALCDHTTLGEPRSFLATWDPSLPPAYTPCAPCVSDAQCGGPLDLCLPDEGSPLGGSCANACGPSRACAAGEECRDALDESGAPSAQCVRVLGCAQRCVPDMFEGVGNANDTPDLATPISSDLDALSVCPGDTDYYRVSVPSGASLSATIRFDHLEGDLDLEVTLLSSQGELSNSSVSATSDVEEVSLTALCGEGGEALIKVYGFNDASASYTLSVSLLEPLGGAGACEGGCATSLDCPLGQRCDAGACVPSACGDAPCGPGATCVSPRAGRVPRGAAGLCVEPCASDLDCKRGEACKRFEDLSAYCAPAGATPIGGECDGFDECAGEMICFFEGLGFCAAGGCDATRPCPPSTACASVLGGAACVPTCAVEGELCPGGRLTCQQRPQGLVCVP